MDAQKRYLQFKLAAAGTALLGIGALAYAQGWVGVAKAQDPTKGAQQYFTWFGQPSPEQAAEKLVKSLDRLDTAEIDGPFLDQVVEKVFTHSAPEKRKQFLQSVEIYLDPEWMGEVAKRGIDSNTLNEKDTTYLVFQGFNHLEERMQHEMLLSLYHASDANAQIGITKQGLSDHPGGVAKKVLSDAYQEVRHSWRDAGDWSLGGEE